MPAPGRQTTLVLCGDRDRVNLPAARSLAAGIPHARLAVIPGAGHLWNLTEPDVFSATVGDFFRGLLEPGSGTGEPDDH